MKVFVAGGSGVVGRELVPALVERGHEVVATTTTPAKRTALEAAGARPLILDLLDGDAVLRAVEQAAPDVVVHQATALSGRLSMRRFDASFAATNRLRTEGLDNLLAAAIAAGSSRFVAQSFTGWPNARVGGPVKTEGDPLDPDPPAAARETLAAIRALESTVVNSEALAGVVLRYGALYGPGTSLGAGGDLVEMVRRRRLPLVGDGGGVWSFVHVADAASATVAAIEGRGDGIYNVVDDDPAPVADWLPYLAQVLNAKPPRRVPVWVARLVIGEQGVAMMTEMRGSSNEKAKRELGWRPRHASWRDGFVDGLGDATRAEERRLAA
ncbi:MAG TPA: NAD(P)-dependent oxidoreductase [Gaiellaceae bacterium]|nr:NAD(P)-dependent oxidoreductase [Gaiellaceae bacterium]